MLNAIFSATETSQSFKNMDVACLSIMLSKQQISKDYPTFLILAKVFFICWQSNQILAKILIFGQVSNIGQNFSYMLRFLILANFFF